jgi:hypothetical protein
VRSEVGGRDAPGGRSSSAGVGGSGKSRLVEEFIDGVPSVFFTASGQPTVEADLALLTEAVLEWDLPDAGLFRGQASTTWDAALRLLATHLRGVGPGDDGGAEPVRPPLPPAGNGLNLRHAAQAGLRRISVDSLTNLVNNM